MKIQFIGATERVTGSCSLLRDDALGVQFLVDCGAFQGEEGALELNGREFPFEPSSIDFVLLTHAHMDHCGRLAKLYRDGFCGKVYCTKATAEMSRLSLLDSAKFGSFYDKGDVHLIEFVALDEREDFKLCSPIDIHGLKVSLLRTAHILGAVSFAIQWHDRIHARDRRITFSGDLGNNTKENPYQSLLGARQYPIATDYMVVESTYGDKAPRPVEFMSFEKRIDAWKAILEESQSKGGGPIIIPCFAIQRTQEVLFDLHYVLNSGPNFDYWELVNDASLAQSMTKIFATELNRRQPAKPDEPLYRNRDLMKILGLSTDDEVDGHLDKFWGAFTKNESDRQLTDFSSPPKSNRMPVLVTGGGMCEGGRVLGYINEYARNPDATIVFVGYAPPYSLAGKMKNMSAENDPDASEVIEVGEHHILANEFKLSAHDLGAYYSGHADIDGLLEFVFTLPFEKVRKTPTTVFLNHGHDGMRQPLKQMISARAGEERAEDRQVLAVEIPKENAWYDLNAGCWVTAAEDAGLSNTGELSLVLNRMLQQQRETNILLRELIQSKNYKRGSKKKS